MAFLCNRFFICYIVKTCIYVLLFCNVRFALSQCKQLWFKAIVHLYSELHWCFCFYAQTVKSQAGLCRTSAVFRLDKRVEALQHNSMTSRHVNYNKEPQPCPRYLQCRKEPEGSTLMRCCLTLSPAICYLLMPPRSQSTRSGLQPYVLHLTAMLHLGGLVSASQAWTKGAAPSGRLCCMSSLSCVMVVSGGLLKQGIVQSFLARHHPVKAWVVRLLQGKACRCSQ